jgi:hypothetical protein
MSSTVALPPVFGLTQIALRMLDPMPGFSTSDGPATQCSAAPLVVTLLTEGVGAPPWTIEIQATRQLPAVVADANVGVAVPVVPLVRLLVVLACWTTRIVKG